MMFDFIDVVFQAKAHVNMPNLHYAVQTSDCVKAEELAREKAKKDPKFKSRYFYKNVIMTGRNFI